MTRFVRARPGFVTRCARPAGRHLPSSMKKLWKNYSLSVVLTVLFVVSLGLQTWMGWRHFASQQQSHGEQAAVLGPDGYVWSWGQATFENWQSEFLQLLSFVVLTAFLVHRGSHESRDQDEHTQASLDRIEARLLRMEQKHGIETNDLELDALLIETIEPLKIKDAIRDDLPAPVPRVWYPASLQREEDDAEPTHH